MKVSSKVGQVIIEREGFRFTPLDFSELQSLVESNLGHGGFRFKGRVPRASLGTVKATAEGMRMGERRIYDSGVRNPEQKLVQVPRATRGRGVGYVIRVCGKTKRGLP